MAGQVHIGRFEVPTFRLPSLIHDISKVLLMYEGPIDSPTTNETLADLLGYQGSDSGQYHNKLAALRAFGLLQGYGNKTRVTDLARKILSSEGMEREKAYNDATMNIPLWKEVRNRLGLIVSKFDPIIFREMIVDITGCSKPEAKVQQFLLNAYDTDTKPIRAFGKPKVIYIKIGTASLKFPYTIRGKENAIKFLSGIKISKNETA